MERDWIDQVVEAWSEVQPALELDAYHVTGRISRIAARIAQREEALFGRDGLNRGELGVLSALRTAGPPFTLSPTRMTRGLMLSSAGMTKRLDRLEERGLVRRKPDPVDRRGVMVELTDQGRETVDRVVASNTGAETRLLVRLTATERQTLARLLRKLLAGLEPPTGG